MHDLIPLIPFLALVAIQDILTGIFGAPSIIATMIASESMTPRRAILLSTLAQLVGPFVFGVAVASTVGSEVVESQQITPVMLYAALSATVFWMLFSWYRRIPSSSTHALVGGLLGAVVVGLGPSAVHGSGLLKIFLGLTLTAPLGFLGGFIVTRLCYGRTKTTTPRADKRFNRGQWVASWFLGLAVGSSNAQNVMGITALGLVVSGSLPTFEVPLWVIIVSAVFLAAGNLVGGMRLIRSVGKDFFEIRPIHGFGAEVSSVAVIAVSAMVGGNVSTTHVTSMAIVGAGSAERLSSVRWGFVQKVLLTWVFTIPVTALLAALFYGLMLAAGVHSLGQERVTPILRSDNFPQGQYFPALDQLLTRTDPGAMSVGRSSGPQETKCICTSHNGRVRAQAMKSITGQNCCAIRCLPNSASSMCRFNRSVRLNWSGISGVALSLSTN